LLLLEKVEVDFELPYHQNFLLEKDNLDFLDFDTLDLLLAL
jgi:hypothetical protein